MRLNKIFKNTLLVISAGIILTACATKKEVAIEKEAPKEETKKEEVTKIEKIAGQMQGDVYVGTDSVKYLADGVADRVFFATIVAKNTLSATPSAKYFTLSVPT